MLGKTVRLKALSLGISFLGMFAGVADAQQPPPFEIQSGLRLDDVVFELGGMGWTGVNINTESKDLNVKYFLKSGYNEILACSGSKVVLCYFGYTNRFGDILILVSDNNFTGDETLYTWWIERN